MKQPLNTKRFWLNANFGFTLIELLVVIAIIGILATVGMGNYINSQIKARDAKRKSDLSQIQKGLEMYYNDQGRYPLSGSSGEVEGCGSDRSNPSSCTWGDPWTLGPSGEETVYMKTLPKDPRNDYCYESTDGSDYKIYAILENERDVAVGSYTCNGEPYNYGVSSSGVTP